MPQTTAQAEAAFVQIAETMHESWITNLVADLANLDTWYTAMAASDNQEATGRNYGRARDAMVRLIESYKDALLQSLDEWGASSGVSNPFPAGSREWFISMRQYLDDVGPHAGGSVDKKVTALGWTRAAESHPTGFKCYRVTVDEYGQAIDTGFAGTTTIESVTGPGRLIKSLRLTQEDAGRDLFSVLGMTDNVQKVMDIPSIDENNTAGVVNVNPNLNSTATDGSTLTTLTGWTLSGTWLNETVTPLLRTQTNVIYSAVNDSYIEQNIAQEMRARTPYLACVWVYPTGMAVGDGVTINMGGKSQAYTGLTQDAWQLLVLDRDVDLYPNQFDDTTNGRRIRITNNRVTSGTLYVGAVYVVPFVRYNSIWYRPITNTVNPIIGSKATVADTLSIASKNQNALRLLYLLDGNEEAYLTNAGTNTIADG